MCRDALCLSDTPFILIDNWGVHFDDQAFRIFRISRNGWIDCGKAVMGWKYVNTKYTG